jgi:hypothetical protein
VKGVSEKIWRMHTLRDITNQVKSANDGLGNHTEYNCWKSTQTINEMLVPKQHHLPKRSIQPCLPDETLSNSLEETFDSFLVSTLNGLHL